MLEPGMKIKTFSTTRVSDYLNWIREEGYHAKAYTNYILVGDKIKKRFDKETLSKTMRTARKKKGITREQIAERMGVCKETVRDWELGRRTPQLFNLERYCRITGITEKEIEQCKR